MRECMWTHSEMHEALWQYKGSLLSLSSLVLQSMEKLYRKESQSDSDEAERRSSKNPLFWCGWILCLSFVLKKFKQPNIENEGIGSHSSSYYHLLQKLISHSALLIAAVVGRERGRQQREGIFCALLTKETGTKWLWKMMCFSPISEFSVATWSTNCLKLMSVHNHFNL